MSWTSLKISSVAEIVSGGTPKSGTAEYWGGDVQWLTPSDMGKMKDVHISETSRKISMLGLAKSSAKLIPPFSVILSTRAPIGHLAINTVAMATNQGCRGLIPKSNINTKYLYYFLLKSVDLLNELGTGTTFKELSKSALEKVEIPIPQLDEQKRIVAILDQAFAEIDKARATAETNLKNARELFDSYLKQVFSHRGEEWKQEKMSEVCEGKITDGTHQTPKYFDDGFIFLSSKNVTSGVIDWDDVKYLDESQHIEMQKRLSPKLNDILLAKNGTTGVAAIVDKEEIFNIYVSLALLRPSKKIEPRYLLHFVNSPLAKEQFNKRLKGVGVPNLHLNEIREVIVTYPKCRKKQQEIVNRIDTLLNYRVSLEDIYHNKLNAMSELKKSILQKAFTGELTQSKGIAA